MYLPELPGIAQDYKGQCNLRFDDTNPVKEDIEYVESIKNDVEWLGFHWSGNVRYSSDYFDQLHAYAIELINKGRRRYVDELTPEQIREYRGTLTQPGKNSPYRDRIGERNLALFEKMRAGGFEEGKACLRAKIDMASPFIVMRDPVLYRIKFAEHHQTGNKWCIYPMYDFHPLHQRCPPGRYYALSVYADVQDNRRLYDWVLDNITIPVHPRQYEFSRLNLEYTVMSKRKLNLLVTDKHVEGWDDPRMPTISGSASSWLHCCFYS
ncbi:glutamine--tRNA ligase [Escherichia coli]